MAYLKFKNKSDFLEAVVRPSDNNVIRIITDEAPNLSGFRLYLRDNEDYPLDNGEYEAYTTLYRVGDGWYELSNDGSVYMKEVVPEPRELTDEEKAEIERKTRIDGINGQIDELEKQLSSTDYRICKMYEYSLVNKDTGYDIDTLHKERQAIRDKINDLQAQLIELAEG